MSKTYVPIACLLLAATATPWRAVADPTNNARVPATSAPQTISWQNEIVPLLDRECVKCHGPVKQKGGLDLSTFQQLIRGGDSGPIVEPGSPGSSPLYQFLDANAETHMPPKKQLPKADIDLIARWIAHLELTAPGELESSPPPPSTSSPSVPDLETERRLAQLPRHKVIDHFIRQTWSQRQLIPASLCDDHTFIRRLTIDLTGQLPTQKAVRQFIYDSTQNKRQRLVQNLLSTPQYAQNMAESFDLILLGRKSLSTKARRNDNGWTAYLQEAFAENRPWNDVLREVILARQPEDKASETQKAPGSLWFVYEHRNNHQAIAESLAPVVFGTQIKCAQCHDHPLAHEIKQSHYWGMVAAFNRSQNIDTENGIGVAESAIGGFINFANLEQESQPAKLVFLNGKSVQEDRPMPGVKETDEPTRYVIAPPEKDQKPQRAAIPKFSRRAALAASVTESNPLLARAFVNYVWTMLLGRGLVHPVDEMNSKHPPSHPELLDWLAQQFEQTNFDIKALVEAIVLSEAYQLDTHYHPDHQRHPDAFVRGLEKPLKAETFVRLLLQATGHETSSYQKEFPDQFQALEAAVAKQFPDHLPVTYQATLQQAMFLTNSPELDHLLQPRPGNTSHRLLKIEAQSERIEETYLSILGRLPDDAERSHVAAYLQERGDEPIARQKQFMWSLLTHPEFQMNH